MQVILRLLQSARKYWKYLMISMVALLVLTATQLYTLDCIDLIISLLTKILCWEKSSAFSSCFMYYLWYSRY